MFTKPIKYRICKLCDRDIVELGQTQIEHLEKVHGIKISNADRYYFRAPFAHEITV